MPIVLDNVVDEQCREQFWEKTNAAFQALRDDAKAWQEELDERALVGEHAFWRA